MTITEAGAALRAGKISVRELADAVLAQAKAENVETNAYLEFYDDIDEQVAVAERMFKEGKATPLTGIPMGVKDVMLVKGKLVTAASKILANHRAVSDATAITRLKASGAILLGRTNMDEFAMGGSNENSAYGPVKNPLDHTRVPGGSSGGSAAAVAMGGAIASLGSDTGGSIRQPAAFCGLVGLKPTYGAVSRYGLMAMASSFDQIGPFAKTVEDVETIFHVIGGHDPMDSTSVPDHHPLKKPRAKKAHLTIGVPEAFVDRKGIDPDVLATFRAAMKKLEAAGHTIKKIELPLLPYALPVYYVLMQAEVSSNLARYDGMRYGFSAEGDAGASSLAPTCSLRAITMPTTTKRLQYVGRSPKNSKRRLAKLTLLRLRLHQPLRGSWGRRPLTRFRCISKTSLLSLQTLPEFPLCRSRWAK